MPTRYVIYDKHENAFLCHNQVIPEYGEGNCDIEQHILDSMKDDMNEIAFDETQVLQFRELSEAKEKLEELKRQMEKDNHLEPGTFDAELDGLYILEVVPTNTRVFSARIPHDPSSNA